MTLEEKAALAAKDEKLKNELIGEYRNFILSSASKTLKRSVTVNDDEFMIAMIAFNEAIDRYDKSKGKFLSFASMIIHNRVVDSLRRTGKTNSVPFSALTAEGDEGEEIEFEAVSDTDDTLKWEIEALTEELKAYDISFFELAGVTPKSRKTKRLCFAAVNCIRADETLKDSVIKKHMLPIKEISEKTTANRKTLERHRKYIITATIVLTQDYPAISEYFKYGEV